MNPLFSIVIPLFNKQRFISDTLSSVFDQHEKDYEIIIVNDGSTDTSEAIVSQYKHPYITYIKTKNNGVAAARNLGIQKSKGTYIALLDADDLWFPFYLQEIKSLIDAYPNCQVYATAVRELYHGKSVPVQYSISHEQQQTLSYFKASRKKTILSSSSTVFHKNVFQTIGEFDTTLHSSEDTDYWIRIGLKYQIAFSQKVAVSIQRYPESLSHSKNLLNRKSKFLKFIAQEKSNPNLKTFIDNNRFAFAIESKMSSDNELYTFYKSQIASSSLNWKQKILLRSPKKVLRLLLKCKNWLRYKGIQLTIFG